MEQCLEEMDDRDLDTSSGDVAICVFDVDSNGSKVISEALRAAQSGNVIVALSYPCFELWFLLLFQYVHHSVTCNDVVGELKGHLPYYKKGEDQFHHISQYQSQAVARSAHGHHGMGASLLFSKNERPWTTVDQSIEAIGQVIVRNRMMKDGRK